MVRKLVKYVKNVYYITFAFFYNLFLKRDPHSVLIGAWMGEKFADNSRYLFQYLQFNKERLGLNNIIWATRNKHVKDELEELGYECCLIGTKESFCWHMKAGIHIVCNAVTSYNMFHADIDTRFSFGAKKVQLWHGVGIKAIGASSNKKKLEIQKQPSFLRRELMIEGGWGNAFFLCTSPLNMEINRKNEKYIKDYMFISSYPRHCECLQYMPNEVRVIEHIQRYPQTVLYLPTFRTEKGIYKHPLEDSDFCNWLQRNNVLWVEKPHVVSNSTIIENKHNQLVLDQSIDINVLYHNITVLITDYSSAAFDAVYHGIPTILFTPDLEEYQEKDEGLLMDYNVLWPSLICRSVDELKGMIEQACDKSFFTEERNSTYKHIFDSFFSSKKADYDSIWKSINEL